MKDVPSIIVIVLLVVFACRTPDTNVQSFSSDIVRGDVSRYISVVFGPDAPTLSDYWRFEGDKVESEYELELRHCDETWRAGTTSEESKGAETPQCKEWMESRSRGADSEPSLFYEAVRRIAKVDPERVQISAIDKPADPNGAFIVVVRPIGPGHELKLFHARNRALADLGLVGLLEIDGRPIDELIGLRSQ